MRCWVIAIVALGAIACGKGPDDGSTLHVTGRVDGRTLDNASALAIGSDGHTYTAYIRSSGSFALDLPTGHVYRIVIANSTANGELRTVGHLVNPTSQGTSSVIAVHEGGTWNLGTLSTGGAGSVHTACACGSGSGSGGSDDQGQNNDDQGENNDDQGENDDDQGGDYKCHQKDGDKDKSCDDGDDVELHASHAPGDKCAKHDDDDQDEPKSGAKSCGSKDSDHDGKDDDEGSGGGGSGGGDDGEKGGSGSGGGSSCSSCSAPPPATCNCSKQCGAGMSCVASKCQAASGTSQPH
jgi:hypothetical protein